jgi:hypothetical protein
MMQPVRFDEEILEVAKVRTDPAFREITAGLNKHIIDLLRNPGKLEISCCFEGCCVSWCCIQIS